MIASLGMYDRPETADANDRFWNAIRQRLGFGPTHLTRDRNLWDIWQSPDLLFAQTCGMPYRTRLHDKVQLIGTPDYGLKGCAPGEYYSVFVVRDDAPFQRIEDLAGCRFAYNEPLSQSGWAAPRLHMDGLGLSLGPLVQTGAHVASARAVAEGRAEACALDALTWQMIRAHDDFARVLRVIGCTAPTPTLPYISAKGRNRAQISAAVAGAIADLAPTDRARLHLRALIDIPAGAYLAQATPPAP